MACIGCSIVFVAKLDRVNGSVHVLAQVEHVEVLSLVDDEELAEARREALVLAASRSSCRTVRVIVKPAPADLHDRVPTGVVPHSDGAVVIIIVQPTVL